MFKPEKKLPLVSVPAPSPPQPPAHSVQPAQSRGFSIESSQSAAARSIERTSRSPGDSSGPRRRPGTVRARPRDRRWSRNRFQFRSKNRFRHLGNGSVTKRGPRVDPIMIETPVRTPRERSGVRGGRSDGPEMRPTSVAKQVRIPRERSGGRKWNWFCSSDLTPPHPGNQNISVYR